MRSTHVETRTFAGLADVEGTFGPIADADQVESTYSMFGFNSFDDHINPVNRMDYNLATAIGLKLNVNF
ncbi:MAG: hypothetical protein IJ620_04660 [Bacteroidales bacterium]|nr:hypothetical protein [Bacteroidales bacterium]